MSKIVYPDWVVKHKSKGVYVLKKYDSYYLYRAHSVRVKGTNKVKRVFDGYIGKVDEHLGVIPAKSRVSNNIEVYEYGVYQFIYCLCFNIYKGLKVSYKHYSDSIYGLAIYEVVKSSTVQSIEESINKTTINESQIHHLESRFNDYSTSDIDDIALTAIPIILKEFNLKHSSKNKVQDEVTRCSKMINSYLTSKVDKEDILAIFTKLKQIHLVKLNSTNIKVSNYNDNIQYLLDKYNIEVTL